MFLGVSCERSAKNIRTESNIESLFVRAEDASLSDSVQRSYIDSVVYKLSLYKNDSITRFYHRRAAVDYYTLRYNNEAIDIAKIAQNLSVNANDTLSLAKSYYIQGLAYYSESDYENAFDSYKKAEKFYSDLNDQSSLGEIVLYKAYIYYDIGEYVLCEVEAVKALRLLEKGTSMQVYNCYNLIATALDGQNNNAESIKYYQQALNELEQFSSEGYTDDDIALYRASCFNNIGLVYIKMGQPDKAVSIYREALEYDKNAYGATLYARLLNNYASAKLRDDDFSNLPELFYKSLKIRDSVGIPSDIVASHYNLGEYYIVKKDTTKAINYFKLAYNRAKDINSSYDILKCLKILGNIDKQDAAYYSGLYIHVNDSIQEKAKADRNRFARIAYETDRLEGEKEELAKKITFIIGISVVVLLFVAAIFMIYYLNSRNKKLMLIQEQQRANEEIYQLMFEQQSKVDSARADEKTRIAMELHDGILNNIYAVRLNLEFNNRKTDDDSILKRKGFIKELQQVEGEIRAVSHDLSRNVIFEQNQNFDSILGYMVTSQKNNFGTEFDAHVDATIDWETIPNTIKINIYRIIQEALQNINKYAKAKHATVGIVKDNNSIKITITDDGEGFDTAKAGGGIGVKNFKKRTEALNGELAIESAPGHGTTVMVQFPL